MGNQQTKKGEQSPFSTEELKILEASFRHTAGGHTDKIAENKLLVRRKKNRYTTLSSEM